MPVFIIIILGFLAEKYHLLGENSSRVLTGFVYYFALPFLLFISMANEPISQSLNVDFMAVFFISTIILYIIGFCISIIFKPYRLQNSSLRAMAIASPNTAYIGIPLLLGLFGSRAILPAALSTIVLAFIMVISTIILELAADNYQEKNIFLTVLSVVFKNPLVISPILGVIFAVLRIKLPMVVNSFSHQIGMTAGPCALFAIGQTLVKNRIFAEKLELSIVAFLKLIIHPLIILLLIFIFKMSGFWAASAFLLSSLPTAAVVIVFAQKYHVYENSASALILGTTLLSMVTLVISMGLAFYLWPSAFHTVPSLT